MTMNLTEKTNIPASSINRILIAGGGLVLIVAGMRAANQLVNLLLMSYVITLLFAPFFMWLRKRHIPSLMAIVFILLSLLAVMLAFSWFMSVSLNQFETRLPAYEAQLATMLQNLIPQESLLPLVSDLASMPIPESLSFGSLATSALKVVPGILSSLSSISTQVLIITFIVFFGLLEYTIQANRIAKVLESDTGLLHGIQAFNAGVRKYLVIKSWTGLLAAAANTLVLAILGVDFALLWGLLSFLLNYIPSLGFIIAVIPPFLLALVQFGFKEAFIVLAAYIIFNTITDNVISPRVMGRGLDLSPLAVFVSLVAWTWVLGLVGALMAVPLLLAIKLFLERYDDTRWLAVAISGGE